jgi:ABC-type lipoprotein export system ATPase subunit
MSGLLHATGLRVVRDGRVIVDGVTLRGEPGEVVGIGGPSGSGKTSLLCVLGGLSRPDAGVVTRRTGSQTAIVLQGYGLVAVLTAAENVEVALRARRRPRQEVAQAAQEALDRVALGGLGRRMVERLSGGQQQRVAVARALVLRPDILIADEPTSELDEAARDLVMAEIHAEAGRGALVVLASHDRDVLATCHRTLWIADGDLLEAGASAEARDKGQS